MSEISSQSAAARPRTGPTTWAGLTPLMSALLALLFVAGVGGTYFVSRDIRATAVEVWDDRADSETAQLTATLLQWIESSVTPLHAMATLFQSSAEVSGDEFWDAVTLLEDNQPDFFPSSLVVVLPAEVGRGETWQVVHSISEEGRLAVGSDLMEDAALAPAVAAALESPGQAVIGGLYRDDLGTAWLVPAIAMERQDDRQVVVGLVNLTQMVDGLFDTQAPEGIELRLTASTAAEEPEAASLLFGPDEAKEATLVTNAIRSVVGGARFNFLWDVTAGFQGGKSSTRADMVQVGGVLATVLLTLFITFLLRQNERVARVVRTRTAELTEREAELRLALDNMPGGMFMIDKDLDFRVFNDRYSQLYGLPPGTINSGESLRGTLRVRAERGDYGPGNVDDLVEQRIQSYGKRQSERLEERLPNGRIVEFVRQPTEDGGVVAVVTDITERVKYEETAKRLREAIEGFSDSIILYDKNARVVFTNDRYHELYPDAPPKDEIVGCSQEQLLRASLGAGLIDDPLARSDPEKWLAERLEERRQKRPFSVETVHSSGRTLILRHRPTSDGGLIVAHIDITARKEAEERLAEKETQLRMAMDYMPGALFVVDEALNFVLVNDHYGDLYGHPDGLAVAGASMEEVLRLELKQGILIGEGSAEEILQERLASFRSRKSSTFEDITPAGRYLQISRQPAPGKKVVTVITDITEEKQAEDKAIANERRIRAFAEAIPDPTFILDDKGNYVDVLTPDNANLIKPRNELIGKNISDFFPKKQLEYFLKKINDGLASNETQSLEYSVAFGGKEMWFDGAVSPIQAGGGQQGLVIWTARDITERKKAEELIETQRAQLHDILENVPQGVALFDADKRLVAWNTKYPDTLNVDPKELSSDTTIYDLTKGLAKQGYYGDGNAEELAAARVKHLYSGNTRGEVSFDGKRIFDAQGTLTSDGRMVVIYNDITQRLEAEKKLQKAYGTISDSIRYASSIQRSVLNGEDALAAATQEHLVLWEPRDVVGGDIYWCQAWGDGHLVILADCTGHGVPGAFMTLIASGALDRAVNEVPPGKVGDLIQRMHQIVQATLSQDSDGGESDDGLELGACFLGPRTDKLTYAGARMPLFKLSDGTVSEIRGARQGIGYRGISPTQRYEETEIALKPGMTFCMSSDGFLEQVGGNRGHMFGKRRFKKTLLSLEGKPVAEQKDHLHRTLLDYQGVENRRDDVSVIAFRV